MYNSNHYYSSWNDVYLTGAKFKAVIYFSTNWMNAPSDSVWIVPGTYED